MRVTNNLRAQAGREKGERKQRREGRGGRGGRKGGRRGGGSLYKIYGISEASVMYCSICIHAIFIGITCIFYQLSKHRETLLPISEHMQ